MVLFREQELKISENKALVVNGHTVHMIAANDPSSIDYQGLWYP